MHSIVTTFRRAVIKVEVANFCAAMDTLIDQDGMSYATYGTTPPAVHIAIGCFDGHGTGEAYVI